VREVVDDHDVDDELKENNPPPELALKVVKVQSYSRSQRIRAEVAMLERFRDNSSINMSSQVQDPSNQSSSSESKVIKLISADFDTYTGNLMNKNYDLALLLFEIADLDLSDYVRKEEDIYRKKVHALQERINWLVPCL